MLVDKHDVIVGVYDSDKNPIHYIGTPDGGGGSIYRYIDSRFACLNPFWSRSYLNISSVGYDSTQGSFYVSAPVRAENLSWASLTFQHEDLSFHDYISSDDLINKIKAGKATLFSVSGSSATWMCVPYTFNLEVKSNSSTSSRSGTIKIKPYYWSLPDFPSTNTLYSGSNGGTVLDIVDLAVGGGHPFDVFVSQQGKPKPEPEPEPTGSTETGNVMIMFDTSLRYIHVEVKFDNNHRVVYDTMGGTTSVTNPYTYTIKNGTYNVTATGSYRPTQTQNPQSASVTVKPTQITVNSNTVNMTVTVTGNV